LLANRLGRGTVVVEKCAVLTKPGRIGLVDDSRATPPGLPAILMHYFGTRTAELKEVAAEQLRRAETGPYLLRLKREPPAIRLRG